MTLCLNCLEPHSERPTPVGTERGSQRDPVRTELSLCSTCRDALVGGDLETFAMRFAEERTIERPS